MQPKSQLTPKQHTYAYKPFTSGRLKRLFQKVNIEQKITKSKKPPKLKNTKTKCTLSQNLEKFKC
jgi:arsenate reductase-like glutaredoxin family protein